MHIFIHTCVLKKIFRGKKIYCCKTGFTQCEIMLFTNTGIASDGPCFREQKESMDRVLNVASCLLCLGSGQQERPSTSSLSQLNECILHD